MIIKRAGIQDEYREQREMMVNLQIRSRGVSDPKVLDAMLNVPRHRYVSHFDIGCSYSDGPLPIGHGQTISQPYIVAYMTEKLELSGPEKVLELGTGSGYQTAILAEIAREVYTIEVIETLGQAAQKLLCETSNYTNIFFKFDNGRDGWEEHAPFDRIIITAAPRRFPEILFSQLAEDGIVVAPVGDYYQNLIRYRKKNGKIVSEPLIAVAFVPLV